eukprot:TRINITY_DN47390_c0_g1_i1.p2 TRINITY_DN47390_c0_g1~~TRINITY_DN47390_c0_g1_i1.p2  ORF type:complete len:429 (+),score=110.62 TRINITY_DN47390_c0_g1_i1:85-1287(+)
MEGVVVGDAAPGCCGEGGGAVRVCLHVAPADARQSPLRVQMPPLSLGTAATAAHTLRELRGHEPLAALLAAAAVASAPLTLRLFRCGSELRGSDAVRGGDCLTLLVCGIPHLGRQQPQGAAGPGSAAALALPHCVVTEVLEYLARGQRLAAALVCRHWWPAARAAVPRVVLRHCAAGACGDAAAARVLWPQLAYLSLADSAVSSALLGALSERCPELLTLDLSGCRGLDTLAPLRLRNLRRLLCGGCSRLSAHIPPPACLPALEYVELQEGARAGALGRAFAATYPRARLHGVINLHLRGGGAGCYLRGVSAGATVSELRGRVAGCFAVRPEQLHLVYRGQLLREGAAPLPLQSAGVGDDAEVFVSFCLRSDDSAEVKRNWGTWGGFDGGAGAGGGGGAI